MPGGTLDHLDLVSWAFVRLPVGWRLAGGSVVSVGAARLREEPDRIRQGAVDKGEDPAIVDQARAADERRRDLLREGDHLKAERNSASKRIGEAIRGGAAAQGPEVAGLKRVSTDAGRRIAEIDADLARTEA